MISSVILPFVAFSGLIVGIILAKFCAEEIEPGRKYFEPLKIAIIFILGIALFAKTIHHYEFFILGCLAGYVFRKAYFFLGVAIASVLSMSQQMIIFVSSLTFIFGLPEGTLLKSWKRDLLFSLLFFGIPFALLLGNFEMGQFMSFAAGGLLINPFGEQIENFINFRSIYKK